MPTWNNRLEDFAKGPIGLALAGVLSLVIAILPIVYVYGDPSYSKANTDLVGLNDLTARNVVFLCSTLFGINALIIAILKGVDYVAGEKLQSIYDIQQLYKSSMVAFKSDFLRTTASLLVVTLFFLWSSDRKDLGSTKKDSGALLIIPAICAFVYKFLSENLHTGFVKSQVTKLGSDEVEVQNEGAHIFIALFAFIWTLIQSGVTNNGMELDSEGDPSRVILLLGAYVVVSAVELFVEKKTGKEEMLYKYVVGFWQDTFGIRISRIVIYITLPFLGHMLAHHHTQNMIVSLLSVIIAEGTQVGVSDLARKFGDSPLVSWLRGFQTFWSFVIGAYGFVNVIADSLDSHVKVDAITPLDKTDSVYQQKLRLEATYDALYAVVLVASVVKLIDAVVGVVALKRDGVEEAPQKQKFERFASLGLLVGSAYLWAGGLTFFGMLTDIEDRHLTMVLATLLFIFAIVTRVVDSVVLSVKEGWMDLWQPAESVSELSKRTNDNIRVWLVIGALITSLGFVLRHQDKLPEGTCDSEHNDYNEILCGQGWGSFGLILLHLVVATVALVPESWGKVRMALFSTRPVVRIAVSTTVICLLVSVIGQSEITSESATIKAPDSLANNAIAALVAYLFADAFGDGFL